MRHSTSITAESRVKLQSACDACSMAKIKCDKNSPCQRCQLNGFKCSHSPSKRYGKYSWARRVASQQKKWAQSVPIDLLASNIRMSPDFQLPDHSSSSVNSPPDLLAPLPNNFLNLGAPEEQLDGSAMSHAHYEKECDFRSQWSQFSSCSGTDLTPFTEDSVLTPLSADNGSSQSLGVGPLNAYDCEAKAVAMLHSLHFSTMINSGPPAAQAQGIFNFSTTPKRIPPLDKLLFFNRVVINTLQGLLECPCAAQPQIALLYVAIISKVLFWYRILAKSQCEPQSIAEDLFDPNQDRCYSNTVLSCVNGSVPLYQSDMTEDPIKRSTIQIGMFNIDEEDERLLMRNILLRK